MLFEVYCTLSIYSIITDIRDTLTFSTPTPLLTYIDITHSLSTLSIALILNIKRAERAHTHSNRVVRHSLYQSSWELFALLTYSNTQLYRAVLLLYCCLGHSTFCFLSYYFVPCAVLCWRGTFSNYVLKLPLLCGTCLIVLSSDFKLWFRSLIGCLKSLWSNRTFAGA